MRTTFKTRLRHIDRDADGQTRLRFEADYNDGANSEWAKYTPSLAFDCTVLDEIAERWSLGDAVTFTAETTAAGDEGTADEDDDA